MLFIPGIGLTVATLKHGWKGWALLPVIIVLCAGSILMPFSGDSCESVLVIGVTLNVLCIIILILVAAMSAILRYLPSARNSDELYSADNIPDTHEIANKTTM